MAPVRLKNLASIRVSNVDKKSYEGSTPVRLCNYTDVYYADRITDDRPFMVATATVEQIAMFGLRRGQTLITKDSETADDIGVPAYVDTEVDDLVCGYHLAQITPGPDVDPRFLFWSIASERSRAQFTIGASGVTRFGLRTDTIAGLALLLPAREQQQRIADFLDAETARIDALITAKQQMISMLEARLAGWLDEVLTLPSTPRAPLRRFMVSITQGTSGQAGAVPASGEEWGILKLSAVKNGAFVERENKVLGPEFPVDESLRPRAGDLLVTRSNTPSYVGDACAVTSPVGRVLLPDLIYRLRLDDRMDPEFASMSLRTSASRHHLSSAARGTSQSMVKLRGEDIANTMIPAPSLDLQRRLVESHASRVRTTVAAQLTLTRQIELLRERRQALITAAVTGELAV